MKKSFSQSMRLSNWSAVISANDGSGVPARTKGALPLFCKGKRPRVPLQRKDSCEGSLEHGNHNFSSVSLCVCVCVCVGVCACVRACVLGLLKGFNPLDCFLTSSRPLVVTS